jgi:hypothetical protein
MYIYHRFDGNVWNSFLLLIEPSWTYEFKKSATLSTQISFNLWIVELKFKIVVNFCIQNATIPVILHWNMNVATNFYVSHDILPVMPIFGKQCIFCAIDIACYI